MIIYRSEHRRNPRQFIDFADSARGRIRRDDRRARIAAKRLWLEM